MVVIIVSGQSGQSDDAAARADKCERRLFAMCSMQLVLIALNWVAAADVVVVGNGNGNDMASSEFVSLINGDSPEVSSDVTDKLSVPSSPPSPLSDVPPVRYDATSQFLDKFPESAATLLSDCCEFDVHDCGGDSSCDLYIVPES